MILSTTPNIEGKIVTTYRGVVGTEVIFGAMFIKDWLASGKDFTGGRNTIYEQVFQDARTEALREIELKAREAGADAVVNLRFDYQVLGEKNGMMMVAATGTAVCLDYSKEERAELTKRQEAHAADDASIYIVTIADKQRGPFSILQLRDLHASGKINRETLATDENGNSVKRIADLLGLQ